jgi:hypothetical protein
MFEVHRLLETGKRKGILNEFNPPFSHINFSASDLLAAHNTIGKWHFLHTELDFCMNSPDWFLGSQKGFKLQSLYHVEQDGEHYIYMVR